MSIQESVLSNPALVKMWCWYDDGSRARREKRFYVPNFQIWLESFKSIVTKLWKSDYSVVRVYADFKGSDHLFDITNSDGVISVKMVF